MGGGFTNTNELGMMKYHEAINGPDSKKWTAKVKTEHGRMVKSDVFEKVKLSELPGEIKNHRNNLGHEKEEQRNTS